MSDPVAHVLEGFSRCELRVQRCEACEAKQFPPRAICVACGSSQLTWMTLPSRGEIVSFTVVHRASTPERKARVPYAIALVDCAPGVRLMMNVETDESEALIVGQPVEIDFAAIGDDPQPRPVARPTTAAAPAG